MSLYGRKDWDGMILFHLQAWLAWRQELGLLVDKHIPRCYHPKEVEIAYSQLHGFSDASEAAYAGVLYLRLVDTAGCIHTSLVMAKAKVAPIKRLSVPLTGTLWSTSPCTTTTLSGGNQFPF